MLFTRHATAWVMRQTLFPEACASVTHAECRCGPDMTTPRVCELQDEGVLRWCAPVHYFVHTGRLDDISCRLSGHCVLAVHVCLDHVKL